jgi:hypothetical protein
MVLSRHLSTRGGGLEPALCVFGFVEVVGFDFEALTP